MKKLIEKLKDETVEIENMIERLKESTNPQNNLKIVIDGIINSLREAQQGLEFTIKLLENYNSIQRYESKQLVAVE